MDPVDCAWSNFTYRGPTPDIGDLRVRRGDGNGSVLSWWKPSEDELSLLNRGGTVELAIYAEPIPPVSLVVMARPDDEIRQEKLLPTASDANNVAVTHQRHRRWKFMWREVIGPDDCPLMLRWGVDTPIGSVRVHNFLRPDADRQAHDHPWWFLTLVLAGGYEDWALCGLCLGTHRACDACGGRGWLVDRLRRGSIRFRPANHRHRVVTDRSWTLVVTGPNTHRWGFWHGGVKIPWRDHFARYGYAPCQD